MGLTIAHTHLLLRPKPDIDLDCGGYLRWPRRCRLRGYRSGSCQNLTMLAGLLNCVHCQAVDAFQYLASSRKQVNYGGSFARANHLPSCLRHPKPCADGGDPVKPSSAHWMKRHSSSKKIAFVLLTSDACCPRYSIITSIQWYLLPSWHAKLVVPTTRVMEPSRIVLAAALCGLAAVARAASCLNLDQPLVSHTGNSTGTIQNIGGGMLSRTIPQSRTWKKSL